MFEESTALLREGSQTQQRQGTTSVKQVCVTVVGISRLQQGKIDHETILMHGHSVKFMISLAACYA